MTKKLLSIVLPVGILGLILGGIFYTKHQEEAERQKMVAIATSDAAKKVYEEHFKLEDPNAFTEKGFIQTYQVNLESLEYNPMGGLMVTVIVNDDTDMTVDFNLIDNGDGTYHSAYYGNSSKFWKTRDAHLQKEE